MRGLGAPPRTRGAHVDTVEENFAALEDAGLVVLQAGLAARVGPHMAAFGDKVAKSLRESVEHGARWSAVDWANALGQRTALYRRTQALFQRFDVLVSPTLSRPALAVGHDPFELITIGGEIAGSIRGAWYPYDWPFNLPPPCRVAAVRVVVRWTADRTADRRAWYADRRVLPWPHTRARAPVRAPDAPLTAPHSLHSRSPSCRCRPRDSVSSARPRRRDDVDGARPKNTERPIIMSQGAYGWKVGVPRSSSARRYGLKDLFIPAW